MKIEIIFPNAEVKKLWPEIYEAINKEVKEPQEIPLEKRVRELLKEKLGSDLIRNDAGYKKFFYDVIRLAVDMDTDKMFRKIEWGRQRYGETRHAKGRLPGE